MLRLIPLAAALLLSGCISTTRTVDRTSAEALARADASLRGRHAVVNLASGVQTDGRIRFVRPDSTAWDDVDARRAVPTSAVASLITDNRGRSVRNGIFIGAGVGVALALGTVLTYSDPEPAGDIDEAFENAIGAAAVALVAVGAPAAGATYGLIGGAIAGRRTEFVFVGAVPDSGASAPGRAE